MLAGVIRRRRRRLRRHRRRRRGFAGGVCIGCASRCCVKRSFTRTQLPGAGRRFQHRRLRGPRRRGASGCCVRRSSVRAQCPRCRLRLRSRRLRSWGRRFASGCCVGRSFTRAQRPRSRLCFRRRLRGRRRGFAGRCRARRRPIWGWRSRRLRQLAEAVQESQNLRLQPGTLQLVFETQRFVARRLGLKFGESIRIMLAGVIQCR